MKKNSRTKAPAFQFYAADWLTDPSLRLCSAETRGVWIDLLCFMFLAPDPGFLIVGGQVLDEKKIQKFSGISQKRFKKVFEELIDFGILKQDEDGRYFSKRMIEDARLSMIRKEAGSKGGNPNLINRKTKKGSKLGSNLVNQKNNQKSTPSISSSTSTSLIKKDIKEKDHFLKDFISSNCPNVALLAKQPSFKECETLINEFGDKNVEQTLLEMENFKPLLTKYKSAYLTARNWLKLKTQRKNEQNNTSGKAKFADKLREF